MAEQCLGLMGRLFGHAYRARVDSTPTKSTELLIEGGFEGSPASVTNVLSETKARTYVKDVCVRCGREVSRA